MGTNIKFFSKGLLLLLVSTGLQIFISNYLFHSFERFVHVYVTRAVKYERVHEPLDILVLGDSVLDWTPGTDADRRTIPVMLSDFVKKDTVGEISDGGMHLAVFRNLLTFLKASKNLPKVLIVSLNLRSFSAPWMLDPHLQYEMDGYYLRHGRNIVFQSFYKFLFAFNILKARAVSEESYRNDLAKKTWSGFTGRKLEFYRNYFDLIEDDNLRLQDLRSLLAFLKSNNIQALLYMTPIDIHTAEQEFGTVLRDRAAQNIKKIESVIQETGFPLLNLAFSLDPDHFNYHQEVNEHLKYTGRLFIAKQLAARLSLPDLTCPKKPAG